MTFEDIQPDDLNPGGVLPEGIVSPRRGNTHGIAGLTPELRQQQNLEAWAVRAQCEAGEWPAMWLERYGLPASFWDMPEVLRRALLGPNCRMQIIMCDDEGEVPDDPAPDPAPSDATFRAGDFVRMDRPTTLAADLLEHISARIDGASFVPFVQQQEVIGWCAMAVAHALQDCFDVKWAHLEERPFEALEKATGIPRNDMQQYPHPGHPEFPAGHGAFCGAVARELEHWVTDLVAMGWLSADTGRDMVDMVLTCTQLVAMFRTISGMHNAVSNQVGWLLGYAGKEAAAEFMDNANIGAMAA